LDTVLKWKRINVRLCLVGKGFRNQMLSLLFVWFLASSFGLLDHMCTIKKNISCALSTTAYPRGSQPSPSCSPVHGAYHCHRASLLLVKNDVDRLHVKIDMW